MKAFMHGHLMLGRLQAMESQLWVDLEKLKKLSRHLASESIEDIKRVNHLHTYCIFWKIWKSPLAQTSNYLTVEFVQEKTEGAWNKTRI